MFSTCSRFLLFLAVWLPRGRLSCRQPRHHQEAGRLHRQSEPPLRVWNKCFHGRLPVWQTHSVNPSKMQRKNPCICFKKKKTFIQICSLSQNSIFICKSKLWNTSKFCILKSNLELCSYYHFLSCYSELKHFFTNCVSHCIPVSWVSVNRIIWKVWK